MRIYRACCGEEKYAEPEETEGAFIDAFGFVA